MCLRSRKKGPAVHARFLKLAYCDGHKEVTTLADVLSDEAFVKIAKFMRENGKKMPLHRNTTLIFEPLSPNEQQEMAPDIEASRPDPESLPF